MNIQFEKAWILYMIWLVPAIAAWWITIHKRSLRALNKFIAPQLREKLFPAQKINRRAWQIGLISTAAGLLLIAAAGPKWGEREETVYQQARDLVIAVDVSRSMLANDVHPSRLGRAKIDLIDLIKELHGDRAALIAFRAKARLICPLTTDYAFLRQALDGISPDSAPRGATNIGDAIEKALNAFDDTDSSHKAIILISDGEDLTNKAQELAKKAGKRHIPIYTIGIGSSKGSRIPDSKSGKFMRHDNKDVITKLHNDTLYAIAKASGGSYIPIETASMTSTTLGTIYKDHLRRINARELAETKKTRAIDRYQWFLLPAIILLLAAAALSRGRVSTHNKNRHTASNHTAATAAASILLACFAISAGAQTTNSPAATESSDTNTVEAAGSDTNELAAVVIPDLPPGRKGARYAQKLFKQGKYAEAAAAYIQSANGVSREAARDFKHNAALALILAGKYQDAADTLSELTLQARPEDRDENGALGVAFYRSAEKLSMKTADDAEQRADLMQDAAEAFKEAWRNTDAPDARDNIAVIIPSISEAREQAKIIRLNKEYEKTAAPELADKMLRQQRKLCLDIPPAITNPTPQRITMLENLAQQQKDIADLWIPLTGKMAQAMQQQGSASNAQHFAALTTLMGEAKSRMLDSADKLRDLDPEGFRAAKVAEHETYQLWKTVASYNMLLDEDILQQTNSICYNNGTKKPDLYTDPIAVQKDAAQLTEIFKKRFEKEVPPQGTQKQQQAAPGMPPTPPQQPGPTIANLQKNLSSTNQPQQGISAEDRAKIVKLAAETIELQKKAAQQLSENKKQQALPNQISSHQKLLEIKKLLPKQNNQNKQCQNPKQQQNKQQKNKQQKQKQQNKQQQNKQQNKQNQDQKKQQNQKKQDQKKQDQKQQQKKEEDKHKDVRKLLMKALEREREHKEEKAKRMNSIPLPPFERDW